MADHNGDEASSPASASAQDNDNVFRSFQEYRWDLDRDFLGGLVLALGGYHALAQTASQADIVMHSRIFYFARISGTTIPFAGYRHWLRAGFQAGHQPRLWEWDLLEALCNHRDRLASAGADAASLASRREKAAADKARWVRALLDADTMPQARPATAAASSGAAAVWAADESTPSWMAAAPKGELYVDRTLAANAEDGEDSSPAYPARFAAIIKAVQTGGPVEGIVDIPDIVARNPTTTPFGSMARPPKPWEKAQPDVGTELHAGAEHGLAAQVDEKFPDSEAEAPVDPA
ncbi:hypothetical protein DHEL01_v203775 [Diaporthe helianthi]|uniref:Uncharacterized protein n=1 Tax=Diaporthe helianthi TaxID=158607 RepID=A0A2P5I5T7_DIAHE|nr:hypothetical protein DHEL01_v203775 [Diaporthe helianthi]